MPGISPKEALGPRVDAAIKALKDAGVDDKETLGKRRNVVQLDYHKELMQQVEAKFSAYYEEIGASAPAQTQTQNANADQEFTDDIPF